MIEIKYCQVLTGYSENGKDIVPSATLEALVDGQKVLVSSPGVGPIDAAYNAINKLGPVSKLFEGDKRTHPHLRRFVINAEAESSETAGSDAIGAARVTVFYKNQIYNGIGRSKDIIRAAVDAYVDVLYQILGYRERQQPPIESGKFLF